MSRLLLTLSEATADAAQQDGSFDEVFLWTRSGRTTPVMGSSSQGKSFTTSG